MIGVRRRPQPTPLRLRCDGSLLGADAPHPRHDRRGCLADQKSGTGDHYQIQRTWFRSPIPAHL